MPRTVGALARWLESHPLASVFLIVVYIYTVHAPALHGALLESDTLDFIAFAIERGPFALFTENIEGWSVLYRPFYGVQAWLYYRLFGLDYAGYHVMLILQYVLLTVLLYKILRLAAVNNLVALLAALAVFVHPFSYLNTRWIIDPATLSAIAVAAITMLLVVARDT